MRKIFIMLLFCSFVCKGQDCTTFYSNKVLVVGYKEKTLTDTIMKEWQHKDIFVDTIPGVSSDKAYKEVLSKQGGTVIVAIIDSGVDIDHEDLKDQIWVNPKEIPNNNKDDDGNGYVDDIHGWNFLGNATGESTSYARNEYVRILKTNGFFSNKGELIIPKEEKDAVILQAARFYKENKALLEENKAYTLKQKNVYKNINNDLKVYFPNQKYTKEKLKTIDTLTHPNLKKSVKKLHYFLEYDLTQEWLQELEDYNNIVENYKLNPEYDDQKVSGDDKSDIRDNGYGNNDIKGDADIEKHGTIVAGLIGASRDNEKGMNGIADKVALMILKAAPSGDEYDKDIALAIRYAVDNGAKVINMSFGKYFSPQQKLVSDAIEYAAQKDVLIVHAAGNDSNNIDAIKFYPIDYSQNVEFAQNFINVGSSNYKPNKKLPSSFSNYGKTNVDVFAPGYNLYTTSPNDKYIHESGTSLAAPVVSGIAAILRSRYPSLNAVQIKNIIVTSGNSYNMNVRMKQIDGSIKMVPFSSLSKSGKIVNAYNALLMAEKMVKGKK